MSPIARTSWCAAVAGTWFGGAVAQLGNNQFIYAAVFAGVSAVWCLGWYLSNRDAVGKSQ